MGAAATVEEMRSCLRAVSDADALDGAGADTRIADVLDSFARVRLVPELEDRFRVRLGQADLAPEHWETIGTLLARVNHLRGAAR